MCRQTLTTADGPERHRRFYLAALIGRDMHPNSRPVMSGIVDSGPEGGHGNADANDPKPSLRYGRASAPGLHKKLIDQERVGVGKMRGQGVSVSVKLGLSQSAVCQD